VRKTVTGCLFILLFLSPVPGTAGDSDALLRELESLRQKHGVAAFGLVLVNADGSSLTTSWGLADRSRDEPISRDAIFRIGSITKMFTGLAALQLAESTDFELDAPLPTPAMSGFYRNAWADTAPVTVRQLLEHTAGLPGLSNAEWDFSDPGQPPLEETLGLYPESRRLQWPAGMHMSYSNAGAGLVGRAMEVSSGQNYEELMQRLVFRPLGLGHTSVFPPPAGLPTGYDRDGVTPIPYWHQIFRPFGAINSNLDDMGRFVRVLINRGEIEGKRLVPAHLIGQLENPTTSLAARRGLDFGYGLGNYSWLRKGVLFHGHGGDADGYLSRLGYTRANNSGYFLVITAFQGRTLQAMRQRVEDYLVAGLDAPPAPAEYRLKEAERRARVGRYEQLTWRFAQRRASLIISEKAGRLYSRLRDDDERRLLAVTADLYRRDGENRATLFLGAGDDGRFYYQEDQDNFGRVGDGD
jgi:CubicO group peptidase (beta-lactamase class C family)